MNGAVSAKGPENVAFLIGLPRRDERRLKWAALAIALAVHALALSIRLPAPDPATPRPEHSAAIVVKRYVPPPPRVEPLRVARQENTRRLPIPDPTPMDPEPIREAAPPVPPDSDVEGEVEIPLGAPEAPPEGTGIALAGAGGVTLPVLIPETKAEPEFPEPARLARVSGSVILQAVITKEGAVTDPAVLRCDEPNMGFEAAAIAAVSQWRYHPALAGGRPVDAYFTVYVSFDLL